MIVLHICVKKAKESRPSSNWNYWLQFIAILSSLSAQGFLIWWCCFSVIQACLTLCDPMDCSLAGFPVHNHFPELAQTHVHGVGAAIQPSHPLSSPSPPAFNLSQHQVFPNKSVLHIRWPKYWSFSIGPSNEYLGLISFRIDGFDLLAVQGTLKSILQHHSSKASVPWHSAFFTV